MNLEEYTSLDGLGLAERVRNGDATAQELAELAVTACARVNTAINAVIEIHADRVKDAAEGLDSSNPFVGVPFLLKDISLQEKGRLQEGGCELLKGNVAKQDSELVTRFRAAGFNLLGRTTTPELGWSASTECRLTGITRNPWDLSRSAGGSSGGAAAAVAAGIVPVAHASDGSGSIRSPASYCGLVGLKTSRGRISLAPAPGMTPGAMPVSFVVSRSLRDSAAVLDAVHGSIGGDPYSIRLPERPYLDELKRTPGRFCIACASSPWNGIEMSTDVGAAHEETVSLLSNLGHRVVDATPDIDWAWHLDLLTDLFAALIAHGVDAAAARLGRTPGSDNLQNIIWATYRHGKTISAQRLIEVTDQLDTISRAAAAFFDEYDLLLTPTSTDTAPEHGTHDPGRTDLNARQWTELIHGHDSFLPLANITGQPAITLPAALSKSALPIGAQLMARLGDEATLFAVGGQMERERPWAHWQPPIHASNAQPPQS